MRYDALKDFNDEEFRRLTGVMRTTFEKMVNIIKEEELKKKAAGGKPNNLEMEDRVLMALEYMREYRTYFHIGASYGISESSAYRNIKWIEDILIKHPDFGLPGKKALVRTDMEEVLLIDATETACERPKKSKNIIIPARKKDIH